TYFNYETLAERLRESAFLLPNLKITFTDERKEKSESYYYENGLIAFIEYLNEGKDGLHEVLSFSGKAEKIEVDFAFQFTNSFVDIMHSFVNQVRTKDGGTHEVGARNVITRTYNVYVRINIYIKDRYNN